MGEMVVADYFAEQGEIKALRRTLIGQARTKFRYQDAAAESALCSITDIERLDRMAKAVLSAEDWQELLATS